MSRIFGARKIIYPTALLALTAWCLRRNYADFCSFIMRYDITSSGAHSGKQVCTERHFPGHNNPFAVHWHPGG